MTLSLAYAEEEDAAVPVEDRVRIRALPRAIDPDAAAVAAHALLRALGIDPDDPDTPDLARTPKRFADAYAELLSPQPFDFTTFANPDGYDELVLVRDIPVHSICEHHLLPFSGVAHVAYLPADRVVGLSKIPRMVDHFSRRPQTQERLTVQVADALALHLQPRGVGVVIEATHSCMTLRGARAGGAATKTSALRGVLREDARSRAEFLALVTERRA
ncbi:MULTISPECIES: GTP cyclohydrolase I FolE [unclassified Microbacterium]|uniref:GTP cyclohydrolase I FolE n=1 Tax=unclassified Microbacterium TaxID=2609290 RepID=UPI0012FCECA2|nr:GTP cyclohydrolase I FolE [Microbacterium sp. MAH-37]MVQ42790.1 GTP cyclohydrolase I FolE [Microbacterium sp. MAH-37]